MNSSPHVQSPFMNAQRGEVMSRSIFWPVLSVLVGGVFIYAGVLKAWDPLAFTKDIVNFKIVPWPIAVRMAFYLPWLEILCGVALIAGRLRTGAIALLTGLMVVFIGATVAAKARGLDLSCGCFGSASKGLSFTTHMVIDGALLAALLVLWLRPRLHGATPANA